MDRGLLEKIDRKSAKDRGKIMSIGNNYEPLFKKVVLEKIKFRLRNVISSSVMDTLKMESTPQLVGRLVNDYSNQISNEISLTLLGETLGDVVFEAPLNWWEAIKERWFPKWLRRKYPVKWHQVRANQKVVYPKLNEPQLEGEKQIFVLNKTAEVYYEKA